MIYYISDLHFFHKNVITFENRPFEDVNKMTEGLIEKWNKKVKENDDVYFLGDLFFPFKPSQTEEACSILDRLNGKKHWITGNHDYAKGVLSIPEITSIFEEICAYKEISDNNRKVILFHYPLESWNGSSNKNRRENYFCLYGHVHSHSVPHKYHRYNVSCEVLDYEPKTLSELIKLNKRNDKAVKDQYEDWSNE